MKTACPHCKNLFNQRLVSEAAQSFRSNMATYAKLGFRGPAHMCGECGTISVHDNGEVMRKASPDEEFRVRMTVNADAGLAICRGLGVDVVNFLEAGQ